jgi:hypothetical protein
MPVIRWKRSRPLRLCANHYTLEPSPAACRFAQRRRGVWGNLQLQEQSSVVSALPALNVVLHRLRVTNQCSTNHQLTAPAATDKAIDVMITTGRVNVLRKDQMIICWIGKA